MNNAAVPHVVWGVVVLLSVKMLAAAAEVVANKTVEAARVSGDKAVEAAAATGSKAAEAVAAALFAPAHSAASATDRLTDAVQNFRCVEATARAQARRCARTQNVTSCEPAMRRGCDATWLRARVRRYKGILGEAGTAPKDK
jgi:hypothetical protein